MARSTLPDKAAEPTANPSWLAHPLTQKALPWLAGTGMALGHAAVASNCTLPEQGRCAACGSCILVVGSLVAWAVARQRQGGEFYDGGGNGMA